jgi:hypothetical protein
MNDEDAKPVMVSRHPMNDTADVEREYRKANIAMLKAILASRKRASREANEALLRGLAGLRRVRATRLIERKSAVNSKAERLRGLLSLQRRKPSIRPLPRSSTGTAPR